MSLKPFNPQKINFSIIILVLALVTAGCRNAPAQQANTQATIDAAVAATGNAQFVAQATIDAAVQATALAQQAQATPTPTNTPVVAPTATPGAEASTGATDYATLSEEELVALIDQFAAAAAEAAAQYATAATAATADDTITAEEAQTIEVYVTGAEEAISATEELIVAYYDLYGDLAAETLAAVEEINDSLVVIAENTEAMSQSLEEINSTLAQGVALAEETIAQVEAVAQTAGAQAQQMQTQAQALATTWPEQIEERVNEALATQPSQIASDPQAAIQSALEFLNASQQATADGNISPAELVNLAQLGANASASLNAQSIPQLQQLSGAVNGVTEQLARGDVAQAQAALNSLGGSLNGIDVASLSLPGGGGSPLAGGEKPSLPGKPSR